MSKLTMVVAFGAGYVLGARAGQDRYRQIKEKATSAWQSDPVQTQASKAQDLAKDQAAKAKDAAKDRVSHFGNDTDASADKAAASPAGNVGDGSATEGTIDPSRQTGTEDPGGPTRLDEVSPGALS